MRSALAALVLASGVLGAAPGSVTTFAGTGDSGFAGDGGPASAATLGLPIDASSTVAFDRDGNVYFPDGLNNRIRKVDARTKVITTFAGDGRKKFAGDGGPALQASFNTPTDLAFDRKGRLVVADAANHRVRRINADGTVETIAGTGIPSSSGDGGPATKAGLARPASICFDPDGNLVIAEGWGGRVRRVDGKSGVITSLVGIGQLPMKGVADGVASKTAITSAVHVRSDAKGVLYVADAGDGVVFKVDPKADRLTIVAGTGHNGFTGDGGPAREARLNQPSALALDKGGNLYIADWRNHRVRRVDAATGVIQTVVGSGLVDRHGQSGFSGEGKPPLEVTLNQPSGLAFDAKGNLWVSDSMNGRIRIVTF